ncbi:MAG: hypothetical protein MJE77_26105, partial [Proteobacteria bacterium]|nr:hypothetical protein [Pseudomonadota bacterium]
EQGWISDNHFRSKSLKAAGKAATLMAATAVTGTLAGEFAGGFAQSLGAGKSAAQLIAGSTAGIAAGLGGHFTADVYDQLLNDKQGFDPFTSYLAVGAEGALVGTVLSGVSLAGGHYLPASAQRTVDVYAERFPRMSSVLERIRASGFSSGRSVRMTVAELLDLLGSGFGGPGGPTAFAYATAGGGDVRALPPDTRIGVTIRPVQAVTGAVSRPLQMSRPGGDSGKTGGPGGPGGDVVGDTSQGTPAQSAETPPGKLPRDVVAIDRVALVDDIHAAPSKSITGSSLEPTVWVERIRAMLAPDELIKFEQMHRNMAPGDIHRHYGGDFDIALSRVKAATAKGQAVRERTAASKQRAAELRAIIQTRGLIKKPAIQQILDELGPSPTNRRIGRAVEKIRSRLVTDISANEAQARYSGARIHRDVEIWVQQPEVTVADFNLRHPNHQGMRRVLSTSNGNRVHVLTTDVDILVVQPQPNGRARIVHREELKSGLTDKPAKAQHQLDKGLRRLSEMAKGEAKIRLIEDGVDITDTIDFSTADSSSGVTRGPIGKGFGDHLGISARDLEVLIKELVALEVQLRT